MESLPSLPDGSALPHRLSNLLHARHSRTLLLHRFHLPDYYTSNRLRLHRRRVEPTRLRHHRWRVGPHVQCSRKRALAPCELLRCIRAPPSAGRTRTLGCSTLRRNTESQSYNNQISYDSIEAESPAGPTRRIRALTSASRTQTLGRSTPRRNAESRFTRRSNQLRFHSDKPGVPDA